MGKGDAKRELILKNAVRTFSHKGYFGTGLAELLADCQIPKGSFYYYFPNGKEQLAAEVLRYAYESMETRIEEDIFSFSRDAVVVFTRMLDHLTALFNRNHIFQSLVITFMGLEAVYISEALSHEVRQIYQQWQDCYKRKLLDCGYNDDEAGRYSLVLFTLVHGALISCWIKQDTIDLQRMKRELPHVLR